MPVLVLFLCLIGNYFTYHSKGDLVQVKEEIYFEGEIISTPVPNSGYVDKVYLNTNLSVEEVVSYIENANLTYDEDGFYFVLYGVIPNKVICVYNVDGLIGIGDLVTEFYYFVSIDNGFGFVGWNPDFNGVINIEDNLDVLTSTENDKLTDLFSITPFEFIPDVSRTETKYLTFEEFIGDEKVKLSFFDITLLQTDNTFIKFQLPFLRNAFESVFNILEFESSYVSSFVLTSFTWMIQLLLLHVVVDTLAFIFKMYHKLMDKVV